VVVAVVGRLLLGVMVMVVLLGVTVWLHVGVVTGTTVVWLLVSVVI
jgi:hypothetical protein